MRTHECWLNEWVSERASDIQYFQTYIHTTTHHTTPAFKHSWSMLCQFGSTVCVVFARAASKVAIVTTKISFMLLHTFLPIRLRCRENTKQTNELTNDWTNKRAGEWEREEFSKKKRQKRHQTPYLPQHVCMYVCMYVWCAAERSALLRECPVEYYAAIHCTHKLFNSQIQITIRRRRTQISTRALLLKQKHNFSVMCLWLTRGKREWRENKQ